MNVFMPGWEFPPFISGGLGTACHGLTEALAKAGDVGTDCAGGPEHGRAALGVMRTCGG